MGECRREEADSGWGNAGGERQTAAGGMPEGRGRRRHGGMPEGRGRQRLGECRREEADSGWGNAGGKRQTAAGGMPEGRGRQRLGECRGERLHIGAEWHGASLDGLRDERGGPRDRPGLQTITGQEQQPQPQIR